MGECPNSYFLIITVVSGMGLIGVLTTWGNVKATIPSMSTKWGPTFTPYLFTSSVTKRLWPPKLLINFFFTIGQIITGLA